MRMHTTFIPFAQVDALTVGASILLLLLLLVDGGVLLPIIRSLCVCVYVRNAVIQKAEPETSKCDFKKYEIWMN